MELALRTGLFGAGASSLHLLVNTLAPNMINNKLETILIISLTPYFVTKVPGILGLGDVMKGGMIPLVSLLMIIGITLAASLLVKEMKDTGGTDILSKYLQNPDDVSIGNIRLNREFTIILSVVMVIDFIVQYLYVSQHKNTKDANVARIVSEQLKRFFATHSTCMKKAN